MSSYGNTLGALHSTDGEKKVRVSERLEEGRQEARNVMGTLKKSVTDIKTELAPGVQKIRHTADNVGGYVKKNPGKAMLITFAMGMVFGTVRRLVRGTGA